MADKIIRIGKVSSIDYASGMIQVLYPDLDNCVTDKLPVLSLNGEYKMPSVGQDVLVAHLSNGMAAGVVLGPYWNNSNTPLEGGAGLYRKELGSAQGEAFFRYSEGTFSINAASIIFSSDSGSISLAEIIAHIKG